MKSLLLTVLIYLITLTAFAEQRDSDLKDVIDSQGNVFSIDEEGDIYTDGIPHENRQPASVENIGYYFNQAFMLEITGHLDEAMQMCYEILSLPDADESVITAKDAVRLRIARWYDNDETRDLALRYFDIKKLREENYEITPRAKVESNLR